MPGIKNVSLQTDFPESECEDYGFGTCASGSIARICNYSEGDEAREMRKGSWSGRRSEATFSSNQINFGNGKSRNDNHTFPISYRVKKSQKEPLMSKSASYRLCQLDAPTHPNKRTLSAKIANFRDCQYLMENPSKKDSYLQPNCDDFYLGVDLSSPEPNRQNSFYYYDYLTQKFNSDRVRSRTSSLKERRKTFVSLVCLPKPIFQKFPQRLSSSCELRKSKKNWIMVEFVKKATEDGDSEKASYCYMGENQLVFCPQQQRTINWLMEVSCRLFLKKSFEQLSNDEVHVELLFSPQGPVLWDDKHLTGRNVVFFCCHDNDAMSRTRRKKVEGSAQQRAPATVVVKTRAEPPVVVPRQPQQPAPAKKAPPPPPPPSSTQATAPPATRGKALDKGKHNEVVLSSKSESNASKRDAEDDDKTSTKVEEPNQNQKGSETLSEKEEKDEKPLKKPPSKLPPPKLRPKEERARPKPKRRESKAICFVSAPQNLMKASSKKANEGLVYDYPEWNSFDITVNFDSESYTKDFLEHKTLQDIYLWIKKELLSRCKIMSSSELLLSVGEKILPLKSNTADIPISSLPDLEFDLTEIRKTEKPSGEHQSSDSNRFDSFFCLPVDIRELERMSTLDYLMKHCSVGRAWEAYYKQIFKNQLKPKQRSIGYSQLKIAMQKLFAKLSEPVLTRVIFLMGIDARSRRNVSEEEGNTLGNIGAQAEGDQEESWRDQLVVDVALFVRICALSNRILCRENKIDGHYVGGIMQKERNLEEADFYNIEEKIKLLRLCPLLKRLLLYVRLR